MAGAGCAQSKELRFVDRCQDHDHSRLDDLIRDGGDAERSEFPICFRDIDPSRWQRSIRSPVNARVQISEVSVKVCRVVTPRHLIHADSGFLLQAEESRAECFDGDMVQERRTFPFGVPFDHFAYASLRL